MFSITFFYSKIWAFPSLRSGRAFRFNSLTLIFTTIPNATVASIDSPTLVYTATVSRIASNSGQLNESKASKHSQKNYFSP